MQVLALHMDDKPPQNGRGKRHVTNF